MQDPAATGPALAARCTACGTVFRVVPDQLRVSDGWVRCGRCAQVFNASETLIDLETGAPRHLNPGVPRTALLPPAASPQPARITGPAGAGSQGETVQAGERGAAASPMPALPAPAARFDTGQDKTPGSAERPSQEAASPAAQRALAQLAAWSSEEAAAPPPAPFQAPAAARPALPEPAMAAASTEATQGAPSLAATGMGPGAAVPSFLQRANRAARWRQPRVRAALGAGCALAALLLLAQAAHAWRDQAAAHFPGLRPALEAGCQVLGCQIGPVRAINNLTVESSALLRVEQTALYQLTVSLRNRSTLDLAVPALELSLTDTQGRLLSRRVLRAAELGAPQPALAAGRDLTLQATLQTAPGTTPAASVPVVAGYTIELFYP